MIKATLNDLDAALAAEGMLSGYTDAEESDGTLDGAIDDLAFYLIRAVEEFNEEQESRKKAG